MCSLLGPAYRRIRDSSFVLWVSFFFHFFGPVLSETARRRWRDFRRKQGPKGRATTIVSHGKCGKMPDIIRMGDNSICLIQFIFKGLHACFRPFAIATCDPEEN